MFKNQKFVNYILKKKKKKINEKSTEMKKRIARDHGGLQFLNCFGQKNAFWVKIKKQQKQVPDLKEEVL